MKKIILIVLCIGTGALAQNDRHDKIKALKTAQITEALTLSSSEAEKFWPVYNAYEEKTHALRKRERHEFSEAFDKDLTALTEEEANRLINNLLSYKARELEYQKELIENLKNVLSPQQIVKLKKVEYQFKRQLLKRYKECRDKP